jgi:hypothetical protein
MNIFKILNFYNFYYNTIKSINRQIRASISIKQ